LGIDVIAPRPRVLSPIGRHAALQIYTLAGRSPSVAVFVTVSVVSSAIVRSAWPGSSGALFTSLTVTVKLLVALSDGVPLSVTMVVNVAVPGPCASFGVQLIVPRLPIQ